MAKTIEKTKPMIPAIRGSAHQIWLAGLGALSLAEDESGKLFNALVKRGTKYEETAADRVDELKSRLDVRKAASNTVDRLGDTLDEGVNEVLHRLGLPTKKEIDGLNKRVERLTKAIEAAPARPRRRSTARRSSATASPA